MMKISIEAADETIFQKMLCAFVDTDKLSLERFDTDVLLAETRRRLGKNGFAVNVVPDELSKAPEPEPEEAPQEAQGAAPAKRRGRPPKAVSPAEPPDVKKSPEPIPTRSEVIAALEKYAERNGEDEADGMLKARRVMAEISGIKNAALKDVDPNDYRKLVDALA